MIKGRWTSLSFRSSTSTWRSTVPLKTTSKGLSSLSPPLSTNNSLPLSGRSFPNPDKVRIMYDKNTGRSRGFGFVYFSSEHHAKSAKDAMDGKALLGRPLRISFALDKVRGVPVVVPRVSSFGDSSS